MSGDDKHHDTDHSEITHLLSSWSHGDTNAGDQLMERVYQELRRMASGYLRGEREGHTLQPTALVHEAYMRLLGHEEIEWKGRAQFFGLAAQTMRRVLIDHARALRSKKRGEGALHLPLDEVENLCGGKAEDLIALDEALVQLAQVDAHKAKIVELRYFGGFEVQEIARILEISIPTVNRHWRSARAWLASELGSTS